MQIQGIHYYDGKSSRRYAAALTLDEDGQLRVAGEWGQREASLEEMQVSEPMGMAPRTLRFADGAYCEVGDTRSLAALLAAVGHREPLSVRLQRRWSVALFSLLGIAAAVVAGYVWLLPAAADYIAPRIPGATVASLSAASLASLDEHVLKPSALPAQRQAEIGQRMAAFAATQHFPAYKLNFRAAPKAMPPNAFALPDGNIVIFDSLLETLNDDEALAVFAHELGHVSQYHGLRMLIQGAVVSTVAAVYLGDLSSLVAALSTAMLQSNYSQAFESEADLYAAQALKREGKSPLLLVSALEKLQATAGKKSATKDKEESGGFEHWFSSHPSVARRSAALRALAD
ncbi:MAG: M48 family metallopeptidase [Rhodocyclaceae bacterium]|nr:M48 family metallopeptidase [Rhodocyclaceae bacterium]